MPAHLTLLLKSRGQAENFFTRKVPRDFTFFRDCGPCFGFLHR